MVREYCQGCGARFQNEDPKGFGYLPENLVQEAAVLCQRCFRIQHYGRDEHGPVSSHESIQAIKAGLSWCSGVVLVTDLLDFEASLARELLRLIGGKTMILAVNKVDLLPEQTPVAETESWVRRRLVTHKGLQARPLLISARNGYGFVALAQLLETMGPRILFVGVTNAGKSSVLQRLLQMRIGGGQRGSLKPTISPYPGTTVSVSRWHCPNGLVFADSPGYVVGNRVSDLVKAECARKIIPHRRLSSHLYPVTAGDLIYIAGLCGMECLSGNGLLLGYAGSEIKWEKSSTRHMEKWLFQFRGPCKASSWEKREFRLKPGEDLVVNGLGWVSARQAPLTLRAHFPAGVKLTVRPNLIGPKK